MHTHSAGPSALSRHARRSNLLKQAVQQAHAPALVCKRRSRLERCAAVESSAATAVVDKPVGDSPAEASRVHQAATPSTSDQQQQALQSVKQLRLRSAAAYLPHPEKESYGGEDAHFVSNISGGAIGVADGVGGWAESGINPAEYSRTLMRVVCAYIEGADTRTVASSSFDSSPCASLSSMDSWSPCSSVDIAPAVVDPRGALDAAHKLTRVPGSATACVVQLCPEQKSLIAANLGDSGFIVVRDGAIAMRSSPKQHFFDCPLQLGAYPEHVDGTDTADDAEIFTLPVVPGDVIIAGSDGLWDNVYNKELLDLVPRCPAAVDEAADKIARLARRHAADPEFASPYTAEAKAQGLDWPWWMKLANTKLRDGKVQIGELTGGKMDDITVLVAMVEEVEVGAAQAAAAAGPDSQAEGQAGSRPDNGQAGSRPEDGAAALAPVAAAAPAQNGNGAAAVVNGDGVVAASVVKSNGNGAAQNGAGAVNGNGAAAPAAPAVNGNGGAAAAVANGGGVDPAAIFVATAIVAALVLHF